MSGLVFIPLQRVVIPGSAVCRKRKMPELDDLNCAESKKTKNKNGLPLA